jgi:hypothetical protein
VTRAATGTAGESGGIRRRTIIIGAAAGLVSGVAYRGPAAVAEASPIPTLPGEITRTATRITRLRKVPYECIDVSIAGDRARLFVPHTTIPGSSAGVGVLWLIHANGSTYTSLDGAYRYGAEMAVDEGAICICPNYGGSLWTTQTAINHQVNASAYMTSVWRVGLSFLRANSGGGPLMTYAYGKRLVPSPRGMYLANAAYDMEDLYRRDPARIGPPYNFSLAAVQATNPARLPQTSWKGIRMKTVVSTADFLVPPPDHGVALANTARPVAAEVIVEYHDEGHVVPGWTQADMVETFAAWR